MKNLNLTSPSITSLEIAAAAKVLKSGWLIRGKETAVFEKEFAKYIGAKYAVATNGCTMALYLALKKLNLEKTDEVIVPSLTWSATAAVVIHAGATPVFADIDPTTWCLDPKDVLKKVTKKTKLVIPVHFAARLAKGFENFPIPVLFDSAHRVEENDYKKITSCYSFYAVKNMTTIRGGMVVTNNEQEAKWYAQMCHGGLTKDTLSRYANRESTDVASFYYEVTQPEMNFDMTDVEAAIGREQLKKVRELNKKRNNIVKLYNKAFGLKNQGNHLYPILIKDRDKFLVAMKKSGIQCSIHYLPLHLMSGYKKYYKTKLPVTEFVGAHTVSIPLYPDLRVSEIKYIIAQVHKSGEIIKGVQSE